MFTSEMQGLPRVIALCGLKRSGKDCVADAICREHGYEKIKIAGGLKEMLKVLFEFSDDQLETDLKDNLDARWGVTPRKIMQFMGTEVMQYEIQKILPGIGRNFWINRLVEGHIKRHPQQRFVISDLRFKHEYDGLQDFTPFLIRVERDSSNATQCTHPSETEHTSIPCDVVFKNNKGLKDIDDFVQTIFNQT